MRPEGLRLADLNILDQRRCMGQIGPEVKWKKIPTEKKYMDFPRDMQESG